MRISLLAFVMSPLLACGSQMMDEPRDVRAKIPTPDPAFLDFVAGESVIPAGEERMICTHLRYTGEDIAFSNLMTDQGKFGHHAVLLGAKEPKAPGTVEDCTAREDMRKYEAYTIGDQELPPAHGVFLPKGKAMVLQSHYVNAGQQPILVRDVVRLRTLPVASVKEWAAIHVTNDLTFSVPARKDNQISYDCKVEKDLKLLLVGGHMHEWGTNFKLEYGMDPTSMTEIYRVDKWTAEFRDSPPIRLMMENPMPLAKGATLRTTCTWRNDTDSALVFPKEMCTSFGYATGSKDAAVCSIE